MQIPWVVCNEQRRQPANNACSGLYSCSHSFTWNWSLAGWLKFHKSTISTILHNSFEFTWHFHEDVTLFQNLLALGQSFSGTVKQSPALQQRAMLFLPSWHLFATFICFYLGLGHNMKQKHYSILQHCCFRVCWELELLPGCCSFWSRHRLPTCGR